jgi:TldD protein
MKTLKSEFLSVSKPLLRKVIELLSKDYEYVSILGTDTKVKNFVVSNKGTEINDSMFAERGFVLRVHNGVNYSEYSFNEISESKIPEIIATVKNELHKLSPEVSVNSYAVIEEEEVTKQFFSEYEINPETVSPETIIKELTKIKDAACALSDLLVSFRAAYNYYHVSKIFLSGKKDLEQSYTNSEASVSCAARRGETTRFNYRPLSGMIGYELLHRLAEEGKRCAEDCIKLLDAKTVTPGEYEIIATPEISGLIAHEAFGHGVEMDMFVKNRAKGAEYIGNQVASPIISMHDGAAAAQDVSSYLFDDEGTLGTDTVIIRDGILQNGISDLLSALKLGTVPTGNGKRQSFERKAYARMTNTFFRAGTDTYEDMLASIKFGYQIEGLYSGMEDPKNWGIQCIAILGREIVDGKFTGNLIAPVLMTGFVPDLLKSMSMLTGEVELTGSGYCGKGYKEFVKTSSGGPYIKAKVRLG